LQLVECAGSAEGVFELADGVVDLPAALAELVQDGVADPGEFPAAMPGRPPSNPEPVGEPQRTCAVAMAEAAATLR
jgi:outer membrane autotransporter protein